MARSKNKSGHNARNIAVAATLAGAAAGAYYLYGSKDAKKHRKALGVWAAKARKEVEREAGRLKDVALDEHSYAALIQKVAKRYQAAEGLTTQDVKNLAQALLEEWRNKGSKARSGGAKRKAKKRR